MRKSVLPLNSNPFKPINILLWTRNKLVLYYFAYQLAFTFLVGLPAGIIKVMNEISENDNLAYAAGKNTASMTGLVMVLAGIAMIWHLIYFKYVQFNKTSWTEVPAKTILLSIPFIIAAMFICNVASEFIELPNLVEDTFIGMSRNVFGIIAIAVHGTSGRRVAVPWSH